MSTEEAQARSAEWALMGYRCRNCRWYIPRNGELRESSETGNCLRDGNGTLLVSGSNNPCTAKFEAARTVR